MFKKIILFFSLSSSILVFFLFLSYWSLQPCQQKVQLDEVYLLTDCQYIVDSNPNDVVLHFDGDPWTIQIRSVNSEQVNVSDFVEQYDDRAINMSVESNKIFGEVVTWNTDENDYPDDLVYNSVFLFNEQYYILSTNALTSVQHRETVRQLEVSRH